MDTLQEQKQAFSAVQSNADLKIPILRLLVKRIQTQRELVLELGYVKENFRPVHKALGILVERGLVKIIDGKFSSQRTHKDPRPRDYFGLTQEGLSFILNHLGSDDFWDMYFYNKTAPKKLRLDVDKTTIYNYRIKHNIKFSDYLQSPFQIPDFSFYRKTDVWMPEALVNAKYTIMKIVGSSYPQPEEAIINLYHKQTPNIKEIKKMYPSIEHAVISGLINNFLIRRQEVINKTVLHLTLLGLIYCTNFILKEDASKFIKANAYLVPEILGEKNIKQLKITELEIIELFKVIYHDDNYFIRNHYNNFEIFSKLRRLKEVESTDVIDVFLQSFTNSLKRHNIDYENLPKSIQSEIGEVHMISGQAYSASNEHGLKMRILFDFYLAYLEIYPQKWAKAKNKIKINGQKLGDWHDKCIQDLREFFNSEQKKIFRPVKHLLLVR